MSAEKSQWRKKVRRGWDDGAKHLAPEVRMDPREPVPLVVDGVSWCIVSLGSITKYHQLCDLKQQTYLEARSAKSRSQQDHAPSETCTRTLPCLFLASDVFQQALVFLGL